MVRPTDRNRFRKDAEAKFPIKIDVRVPAYGEPWPYVEMLAWCRDNVPAGAWAEHGFMDKKRRDDRGPPNRLRPVLLRERSRRRGVQAAMEGWLNASTAATSHHSLRR
jgi:hypothetical protein